MSEDSKRLRKKAAGELKSSRKSNLTATHGQHALRAAAFKALAANEEWLAGERPRSRKRMPKKK